MMKTTYPFEGDAGEYVGVIEFSRRTGVSHRSAIFWAQKGKIPGAFKRDGKWLIPRRLLNESPDGEQNPDDDETVK